MKYAVYVAVGNMPKAKAEEYVREQIPKFKHFFDPWDRVVYFPARGDDTVISRIEVVPSSENPDYARYKPDLIPRDLISEAMQHEALIDDDPRHSE